MQSAATSLCTALLDLTFLRHLFRQGLGFAVARDLARLPDDVMANSLPKLVYHMLRFITQEAHAISRDPDNLWCRMMGCVPSGLGGQLVQAAAAAAPTPLPSDAAMEVPGAVMQVGSSLGGYEQLQAWRPVLRLPVLEAWPSQMVVVRYDDGEW